MYRKTPENIWTGRSDKEEGSDGLRWHEIIRLSDLDNEQLLPLGKNEKGIVLLGFACHEGVKRNNGRPGAAAGPDAIRQMMCNLPVHFKRGTTLLDGGNIFCKEGDLEAAQKKLGNITSIILKKGYFPLILGGGHEVAWGTFQGIADSTGENTQTGIINLDAHFDLRKPSQNGASSGTPFYQIAGWHKVHTKPFKYFVAGIQHQSNTPSLFKRADDLGVKYITTGEIRIDTNTAIEKINQFIKSVDHIYFTICMDVFNVANAPGVSAPNPLGIAPHDAIEIIRIVSESNKLIATDIAEMNPRFDIDQRTAKLAASLAFELLSYR